MQKRNSNLLSLISFRLPLSWTKYHRLKMLVLSSKMKFSLLTGAPQILSLFINDLSWLELTGYGNRVTCLLNLFNFEQIGLINFSVKSICKKSFWKKTLFILLNLNLQLFMLILNMNSQDQNIGQKVLDSCIFKWAINVNTSIDLRHF